MKSKKLSVKIYILPYICTSISLIYFFITGEKSYLSFFITAVLFATIILISQSILMKIYTKKYQKEFCDIFKTSLKHTALLSFIFLLINVCIFIMNYYSLSIPAKQMIIYLFSLFYAVFPLNFLLLSLISFFRMDIDFKRNKIHLCKPDSTCDIYNCKFIIIDKFENFSNLNLINELCKSKIILLTSDLSQEEIKTKFPFFNINTTFINIDQTNLSLFQKNNVYIFSNTSINSLLNIIKLLNKSYMLVSENELHDLCCKVSVTRPTELNIPKKDIEHIVTILNSSNSLYNRYKKCVSYMLTLSVVKILLSFLCIFFCKELPFSPNMLILANIICEIIPPIALLFDNISENYNYLSLRENLSNILLDGSLLSIICFIIFMLADINFSKNCANVICINTYIISVLLYSVNSRSEKNIFVVGLLTNKFTAFSLISGISAVVIITALIYNATAPISVSAWLMIIAMAFIPFIINQLQKTVLDLYKK